MNSIRNITATNIKKTVIVLESFKKLNLGPRTL